MTFFTTIRSILLLVGILLPFWGYAQNPRSDVTLPLERQRNQIQSKKTQTEQQIQRNKTNLAQVKKKPQTPQTRQQIKALERDINAQEETVNELNRALESLSRQIEAAGTLSQMKGEYEMLLSLEKDLAPQKAKERWQQFLTKYNNDLYGGEDDAMRNGARTRIQTQNPNSPPSADLPRLWTNSLGMKFVRIEKGSFMMGSTDSDKEASSDEKPQHRVNITKDFYMGQYEVTQAQWEVVMGSNPSYFKGADRPVEQVSWEDVQVFIQKLNAKEGTNTYRLPTEAEWEYASRAGSSSKYSFGDDASQLCQYGNVADLKAKETNSSWTVANCNDGVGAETSVVGRYRPNAWGLYDVHGNVWEWVQDWYNPDYYKNSPSSDPSNLIKNSSTRRVLRGGSWYDEPRYLRSAFRSGSLPAYRGSSIGFRLSKTLD